MKLSLVIMAFSSSAMAFSTSASVFFDDTQTVFAAHKKITDMAETIFNSYSFSSAKSKL